MLIEQFLYPLQNPLLQTGRFCQPGGDGNTGIGTVMVKAGFQNLQLQPRRNGVIGFIQYLQQPAYGSVGFRPESHLHGLLVLDNGADEFLFGVPFHQAALVSSYFFSLVKFSLCRQHI